MRTDIPADKLEIIKYLAAFAVKPSFRSPILRTPKEYGVDFEDIYFSSSDGTPLEGWYIPAPGSNKLVIVNHPMPMCRYGFPGHLGAPWNAVADFEVNFVRSYVHLHKAGYNVLAYDLRNHGNSGAANGGICGIGRYEWRDCVGVKRYVDAHPVFGKMQMGLFSQCTGANAQFEAITRHPELFENVKCMVAPLAVSMTALMGQFAKLQGVDAYMDVLDEYQVRAGGFRNADMTPHLFVSNVKMPTLMTQVRQDLWTTVEDGQKTFDLLGSKEKELFWIEGTTRRFDGYNYFGEHPQKMIGWFDKYMR